MAPPKTKKPPNHPDGEQCEICGLVIARRGDMPRHKRTHAAAAEKNAMLHRCPWEGCNYSSLQRPNVDTHYRTHTKERNQACPDCDSKFSDPGSLIRHRKNLHGYVPQPRKKRITTAAPEQSTSTRGSQRHQPYSRSPSASSSSSPEPTTRPPATNHNVATTSNVPTTAYPIIFNPEYDFAAMQSIYFSKPPVLPCSSGYSCKEDDHSLDIKPNLVPSHRNIYFWKYQDDELIAYSPSPKVLFPAIEAGKQMEQPTIVYPPVWDGEYSSCVTMSEGDANGMEEWMEQFSVLPVFSGKEAVLSEEGVETSSGGVHDLEEEQKQKQLWDFLTNQPGSCSPPVVNVSEFLDSSFIAPLLFETDSVHASSVSISQFTPSLVLPSSTSAFPYDFYFDYSQSGSGPVEPSISLLDQFESVGLESFGQDLDLNLGVIVPSFDFGVDYTWPPPVYDF